MPLPCLTREARARIAIEMYPALGTKDFERRTILPRHRPMVRAIGEALFSTEKDIPRERLETFVDEVDAYISPASNALRLGMLVLLAFLRWSPIFFGHFRTFEGLSIQDRVRHLRRLESSKLKQLPLLVLAYKVVLTLVFYEDEGEQRRTFGYPGPVRRRWRRALPTLAPRVLRTQDGIAE